MEFSELQRRILRLKEEKKALLLVHNYQVSEIQVLADHLGDSLELCREAQRVEDADLIVFCGVDFMAETAAVLNLDKKVVIPSQKACCPMAAMLPMSKLLEAKKEHQGVPVVLYVNTLAEAKAEATVVCTSANADMIVSKRVPEVEIIPVPDDGYCSVHRFIGDGEDAMALKKKHLGAEVWAHPECEPAFQDSADYVLSTAGMVRRARESPAKVFIVGTEVGLIDRLARENPGKTFLPAKAHAECAAMKRITLENLYTALVEEAPVVTVPEDIASRARVAIDRMLELSV
jgi:quinolinate synthase